MAKKTNKWAITRDFLVTATWYVSGFILIIWAAQAVGEISKFQQEIERKQKAKDNMTRRITELGKILGGES